MTPDQELLGQYAASGDEAAFAEVVRRQVNLVYSVALRVAGGNAAMAEDVTQSVFIDLARKAGPLSRHPALAGWLHTSARFTALKAVRGEQRRQTHENEATMHQFTTATDVDWNQLRPVLDEAVGRLREPERHAVVLRFFQGLSHREVGEALGVNENTARKRVDHALEKLRAQFARSGVTVSSALLASTLTGHAQETAPAGLAEKITGPSLAGAAGGAGLVSGLFGLFLMTKTKILLAAALIVAAAAYLTLGVSWHAEPAPSPEKTAAAPAVDLPRPTMPKPTPSPASAESPAPGTTATAPTPAQGASLAEIRAEEAKNELHPMITDVLSLLRSGDVAAAMSKYTPNMPPIPTGPNVADMPPEMAAQFAQQKALLAQTPTFKMLIAEYEAMLDATPTLNESGNIATYTFDAATWARIATLGKKSPNKPLPVHFYKIKGQWYMDSDDDDSP